MASRLFVITLGLYKRVFLYPFHSNMEYVETTRGKRKLVHNGHYYVKVKVLSISLPSFITPFCTRNVYTLCTRCVYTCTCMDVYFAQAVLPASRQGFYR